MGPVWAYWAYPMERFCGALARANKSRRYPWSSLNRRVLQCSQLAQIKSIYGLTERLDLEDRNDNITKGISYQGYPDLVFVKPRRNRLIHTALRRKVAEYLSRRIDVPFDNIRDSLATRSFDSWGKMQQIVRSAHDETKLLAVTSFVATILWLARQHATRPT